MKRKLFCEISPFTYHISVAKCRILKKCKNICSPDQYATEKSNDQLPHVVYKHSSLILRKLGDVNMQMQLNKSVNLSIAAPKVSGVLIKPNEVFSFWELVGNCTAKKGYKDGLIINNGVIISGIGGGMCQFTNLIHWLVLHSPLDIIEYHHHNSVDMFPDYHREVPFGIGSSVMYNYLDYRFKNNTDITFQLLIYTTPEYLFGKLLSNKPINKKYQILEEDKYFYKQGDSWVRHNKIYKNTYEKETDQLLKRELITESNAKVLYDEKYVLNSEITKR